MLLDNPKREELKKELDVWLGERKLNASRIVDVLNKYLPDHTRLVVEKNQKAIKKILITTGAGNTVQGGADIWVNNFLKEVWPNLPFHKSFYLLIDSKRPVNFDPKSLPNGLRYHFHGDDPDKTEKWLEECDEIYSLHSHYYKRKHIWKYEDKFQGIFVHAYPQEMNETLDKIEELKRLQYNTKVDAPWYDEYLSTWRKRYWIGLNKTKLLEDFPNYTYSIPNYYEFKHNLPLTTHINNGKVGFTARAESRKCLHWLHGLDSLALTGQFDVKNLRDTTTYTMLKTQIYQWDQKIHHDFMTKNWGIFHGAYFKEPFGYSIFQAVDYGKLPILNHDWAVDLDYKYRASSMNEFHKVVRKIIADSETNRLIEFEKLKKYLKKFDNKEVWVDKIRNVFLR